MKQRFNQRVKRIASFLLAAFYFVMLSAPVQAAEEPRVLRVAFAPVNGLMEVTEDGRRYGLVVDYLNEISKYTGWEYEYVDLPGDGVVKEFLSGEYDLMGGTYYAAGMEEYFAYPDYNTGYSKSVLLARWDDYGIRSYYTEDFEGKTIGVYDRAKENIRRLENYLTVNGINCTLRYYTYDDLSKEGNLYSFLEKGEVDLLLGNGAEKNNECRVVASFDSQPYYIVTRVGDQEVLDGLNRALEKIIEANPRFAEQRYAANFPDSAAVDIQLSEEDMAYIAQKETLTVAVPHSYHPLFCLKSSDDLHNGLVPDVLDEIADFTGLKYQYVYTDTYIEAVRLVQQGEADLLCFFQGSEEDSARQGLAMTASYVSLSSTLVRNKAASYPADGLTAAVVEGQVLPGEIQAAEEKIYPDITQALSAVNKGEADFVYGLAARMEWDIQQRHFSNLVPVTLVNDRSDLSFALSRPVDANLLTVLNKAINSISAERKNDILDRNMISIGTNSLSLEELIYANPVMFIVILTLVLAVAVTAVLWVNRTHVRAAIMESNLEKARAESRAKGEFLSHMSHEIRTPMNAVVGLTDLTSMMEDVPGPVQENLNKIRSSSHYLLSLINDILDMSRIDGGMLTIAHEPFSMEEMLGEIQGMMEGEAQRRGIKYTLEKKISHSVLTGDAIRLRQVLTNLLSNAFKFTAVGGSVVLRVLETASSETDAAFSFQVIDSGVGIAPADQERIFQSFEQLGSSSSKSQGTGLGLPISRSIVEMMGGELRLKSELGQGSEFYFSIVLPLSQEAPLNVLKNEPAPADGLLKGVRILLAEDNELNAEIAVQLLEMQGAEVHWCENGKKAVECFEESLPGKFQVILMDIQMPEMNGLEAARAIRGLTRSDAAEIPIVAMTANSFQEDVDAASEAGMNGFVSKPLDVRYLYGLLRNILKMNPEHGTDHLPDKKDG